MNYQSIVYLISWFVFFFALIEFSSLVICGWFATTRGYKHTAPDGKEEQDGMLLKAWYFFWFNEFQQKKHTYYIGDQLDILIEKLKKTTGLNGLMRYPDSELHFFAPAEFIAFIPDIKIANGVIVEYYPVANGIMVKIALEEPHYMFAEWVRQMMAGCITCHASFYGSIIFWVLYSVVDNSVWNMVYGAFHTRWIVILLTWIAYTFSLAYVNTVKYRKF